MNSVYASEKLCKRIWPDFTAHFKSETTSGSYRADTDELMDYIKKDFLEICEGDVKDYFEWLTGQMESGRIRPVTAAKKLRELHSLAAYVCENREQYQIPAAFQDYFYPYLKQTVNQERYVNSIPAEHMDRLLQAAQEDLMAYCILTLLYRTGLTSTEIIRLRPEDFAAYDNGVYVKTERRKEACFIPEDVFIVVEKYLAERGDNPWMFYNRRGNQLNLMYISRMMKKYTLKAGIPSYSAEYIRNTCGVTMFAYGAAPEQVARQMGITRMQIHRYRNLSYRENLAREANHLVKLKVEPPDGFERIKN